MPNDGSGLREDAPAKTSDAQPSTSRVDPSAQGRASITAWGLVMFTGARLIEIFLEAQSMAAIVGQAVLVEWGCSRLGVVWSPSKTDTGGPMTTAGIARRIALGALVGLSAAAALFGVLVVSRGALVQRVANIEASVLAVGLVTAGVNAWRDELLLHGVTLRALEGSPGKTDPAPVGALAKVLACGLTSGGAALGRTDATPRTVFSAALLGIIFGVLWVRDRGAWQPWAAHTGFRFATGTLLSGGVVYGRLADDSWAGGSGGILAGTAAAIGLAPMAIVALVWAARRFSPQSTTMG